MQKGKINKLENAIKTKGVELRDTSSLVKVAKTSGQRRERDFIFDIVSFNKKEEISLVYPYLTLFFLK